jgi:hypothetical protein
MATYMPGAKERAATKGFDVVKKRAAKHVATKTAAAEAVKAGSWGGLLKAGNIKGMLKKPGGILGALFLAQFIMGRIMNRAGEAGERRLEGQAIDQQAGMSEEDAYYQAALPGLTQERQMAQDALMQSIMGGRGQPVQVPGEVRI